MAMSVNGAVPTWPPNLAGPEAARVIQEILGRYNETTGITSIRLDTANTPDTVFVECASGISYGISNSEYAQTANQMGLSGTGQFLWTTAAGSIDIAQRLYFSNGSGPFQFSDAETKAAPRRYFILAPGDDDERPGMVPKEVAEPERDAWLATAEGKLCAERLFETRDVGGSGWHVRTVFQSESYDARPSLFATLAIDASGRVAKQWTAATYDGALDLHREKVVKVGKHVASPRFVEDGDADAEVIAAKALGLHV